MSLRLAIVGAGPKAAAIVARAFVLRKVLGRAAVPEILVFEREGVAAAWNGKGSFSSGFLTLCTPGEKDVGFPYDDTAAFGRINKPVAPALFARFSWNAYLVAEGKYADWIDRDRDHPSHAAFADYLDWVFDQAGQDTIPGDVERIWRVKDKWCINYRKDKVIQQVVVDGIVLTGAGASRQVQVSAAVPAGRVFDAETFWPVRNLFLTDRRIEIAVAGDGGSAGAIVAWLADRFAETSSRIWSISPMGTLFPRGDGHAERRWFSFPQDWPKLSYEHREKLIDRTEAGVVSMRNKRMIDRSARVEYEYGKVASVDLDADDKLALKIAYDEHSTKPLSADYLVNAIGFDPWTRLGLVDHPASNSLKGPVTAADHAAMAIRRGRVERAIAEDLSMPASEGFPPGIHVPALAGLEWGPGMSNLGCLGLMAGRVLKSYVTK